MRPESSLRFRAGQYLKLELPADHANQRVEGYSSIASPARKRSPGTHRRREQPGTGGPPASHAARRSGFSRRSVRRIRIQARAASPCLPDFPWHRHCAATLRIPIRSFAESMPLSTTFLLGFRNELEVISMAASGSALPAARYLVTLSQPQQTGWPGLRGRVTDHLKDGTLSIDWMHTEFYLCGSSVMVAETRALLAAQGRLPLPFTFFNGQKPGRKPAVSAL